MRWLGAAVDCLRRRGLLPRRRPRSSSKTTSPGSAPRRARRPNRSPLILATRRRVLSSRGDALVRARLRRAPLEAPAGIGGPTWRSMSSARWRWCCWRWRSGSHRRGCAVLAAFLWTANPRRRQHGDCLDEQAHGNAADAVQHPRRRGVSPPLVRRRGAAALDAALLWKRSRYR